MEIDTYVKENLKKLGLSTNEIALYLAILRNPQADAPKLIRHTGLSKACVYKMIGLLYDRKILDISKNGYFSSYEVMPLSRIGKIFSSEGRKLKRIGEKFKTLDIKNISAENINIFESDKGAAEYLEFAEKIKDFIWCVGSYKAGEVFHGKEIENEFINIRLKKGAHANALIFDDYDESKNLSYRDVGEKRETKFITQSFYPLEFTYLFDDIYLNCYQDENGDKQMIKIQSFPFVKSKIMQFQRIWQSV